MKYPLVLAVLLAVCLLPAWATRPGEYQDCSDWMQLEPGYICTTFVAPPCDSTAVCEKSGTTELVDTHGRLLFVRDVQIVGLCWPNDSATRTEIVAPDGTSEVVLGTFSDRCDGPTHIDRFRAVHPTPQFDRQRGALLIRMSASCDYDGDNDTSCPNGGNAEASIIAIEGFATTFEILQTYTPAANEISFRVPYMPEGFQFADFFDTYYGDLATVGDWSQAQPLQCGYPTTAPSVGDYLTVADTLPDPPPGQGRYYITAVNYQGQTRYGRKSSGGVLTGRDPAVLPACN